ncbi:MAG TPA: ABC-2 family transporter protein [Phycisphaerae bacterium]|nr:ABC-2 family transporter protein [Phycisphaerae bacterium]
MLRILKNFWLTSLASEMEYRANFLTSSLYSLGQLAGTLFTINILYNKGYRFAGWSLDETYLVVSLFTLLDGITTSALSPNLSKIIVYVQRGTLDFILLKPLDSQFQLSTRNLTPWGFPNITFALILMGYAGGKIGLPLYAYALGILPIFFALVILYSLWFAVGTTTIWFTKVWNATEVLRSLLEAGKYPMGAYPLGVRFVLTFILPIAFITTFPAEVMRGAKAPWFILIEGMLAAALFCASRSFWKLALRSYTSASS